MLAEIIGRPREPELVDDVDFRDYGPRPASMEVIDVEPIQPPWTPPGWLATGLGVLSLLIWPGTGILARRSWTLARALHRKASELREKEVRA